MQFIYDLEMKRLWRGDAKQERTWIHGAMRRRWLESGRRLQSWDSNSGKWAAICITLSPFEPAARHDLPAASAYALQLPQARLTSFAS